MLFLIRYYEQNDLFSNVLLFYCHFQILLLLKENSSYNMSKVVIKQEPLDHVIPQAENQTNEQTLIQSEMEQPTGQKSSASTTNKITESGASNVQNHGPELVEVSRMRYRNFHVKIFKQLKVKPVKYFYEPFLLLDDSKQIQSHLNISTGQAYVRFTVQMWDEDIGEQVFNCLKRLPDSQDLQDYCVQTMPYEKVRLVFRENNMSSMTYRLPEKGRAYQHLPQSLQFHLLCETKEAADTLAESFRADPEYVMQDLALECLLECSIATTSASNHGGLLCKRPRLDDALVRSVLNFNINLSDSRSSGNQGGDQGTEKYRFVAVSKKQLIYQSFFSIQIFCLAIRIVTISA